jgi:hypothetical protein
MQAARELLGGFLVQTVAPVLKAHGFVREDKTWYLRRTENWGIVAFQSSTSSTKDRIRFTANVGINSRILADFWSPNASRRPNGRPSGGQYHWEHRIGELLPQRQDTWWTISAGGPNDLEHREVTQAITDVVIPVLERHTSEQGLLDLLLVERASGSERFLISLAVLLHRSGQLALYQEVRGQLLSIHAGRSSESRVRSLVGRIEAADSQPGR